MGKFDAILWDIDGTLLSGKGIGREATRMSMETVFGTSANIETHHFGGKTDFQTLLLQLAVHDFDENTIREHLPQFAKTMAANMQALTATYDVIALPHAMELLNTLLQRDDLLHGLVTGNVAAGAPVKLRAAGYDPSVFTFGAYGDEVIEREDLPPRAIQRACELAKRTILPERVLIIGDTIRDISAARANNIPVCVVATGSNSYDELAAEKPDFLLRGLNEFLETVPMD